MLTETAGGVMMKTDGNRIRVCPLCGVSFQGVPALSRKDNQSFICPDCGTREALESIGVCVEEQNEILAAIHRCGSSGN